MFSMPEETNVWNYIAFGAGNDAKKNSLVEKCL
jgi:hypothetical protein